MFRNALLVLFFIGGSLSLTGMGRSGDVSHGDGIRLGVTLESTGTFLQYVKRGLEDFAEEHPELTLDIRDCNYDAELQVQHVLDFVALGYDGVIIKPTDPDATKPISEACAHAGIPLVAVNALINSPYDTYVASDNKNMGIAQAEYLAASCGGKGNVGILVGDPTHGAALERTEGFKEVMAKHPGMIVIAEMVGSWDRARGREIAASWIKADLDIQIIMANNDEMAIGAAQAYEEAGLIDSVLIGGVDATADALSLLKKGTINVTVLQNGIMQGYRSAEAAWRLVKGENVPSYVNVPHELVPPERADEILRMLK